MTLMRQVSSLLSEILRVKWIMLAILVLAIAGGAAALYQQQMTARRQAASAPVAVQSVSAVPVRVRPMVENIASYGNLVSQRSVNIVPQTPGQVKKILFSDGQKVTAGAELVLMDAGIAQAQVQATRAQSESDTENLKRTQSLSRQGLESTYSLEQAQSRASASAANVAIDERRLDQLTLRAPFAGRLGSRQVDVGAFVMTGDTIVRLDDAAELQIEFRMPSTVALRVKQGMPVHVQVPGTEHETTDGSLSFIDPTISTDTRSVLLRALVPNTGQQLRPGLYVRVSLDLDTHPDALVVPIDAIANDLSASYVFVVDTDNIVHRRPVTRGVTDGLVVELLSGVKAGEQVVTVGQFRLRDGDTVKIVPPQADAKSAA